MQLIESRDAELAALERKLSAARWSHSEVVKASKAEVAAVRQELSERLERTISSANAAIADADAEAAAARESAAVQVWLCRVST